MKLEFYQADGQDSDHSTSGSNSLPGFASNGYNLMDMTRVPSNEYIYPTDNRSPPAECKPVPSFVNHLESECADHHNNNNNKDNSARNRSPKKPTPVEAKDEKYSERRRRNNAAAKKSRDARKQRVLSKVQRQDFLERENAKLREEMIDLRRDVAALRQLLDMRRAPSNTAVVAVLPSLNSVATLMPKNDEGSGEDN